MTAGHHHHLHHQQQQQQRSPPTAQSIHHHQQVSELKRVRAELHKRLAEAVAAPAEGGSRMERELARLQATAAADVDAIRKETHDAAEREVSNSSLSACMNACAFAVARRSF